MKPNQNKCKQNKKQWKPRGLNKNKRKRPTNKQTKVHIKFDPDDRKQYLKGFQKRKRERREKAHKKIEDDLKKEMRQIRKDRVQLVKKMIYQGQEMKVNDEEEEEEEENKDNKNVTVTNYGSATVEISGLDLVSSQLHIGTNQIKLDITKNKPANSKSADDKDSEEDEEMSKEKLDELGIWSPKDLYRSLKKSTFQVMKKSSLIKLKQARDAKKQKKAQSRINNHRRKLKMKKMKQKQAPSREKAV